MRPPLLPPLVVTGYSCIAPDYSEAIRDKNERMNQVVFFTGCDARYFSLCIDLINSIKAANGALPRMRILDLGLEARQLSQLKDSVEAVIEPSWELGQQPNYPSWFRGMTSRPFLPTYAADAEIVVWIDADTWVQRWHPLEKLVNAAYDGALAIVEEQFGQGFTVHAQSLTGTNVHQYSTASLKANLRRCYEQCFGNEIANALSELPAFNSGVFALRANSPTWKIWRDMLSSGLRGGFHMLVEQQALSIAIRQGRVPVALQPQEANFVCVHELPWFDPIQRKFTLPKNKDVTLGIVHLTDAKNYGRLPISNFPDGVVRLMSLLFRDYQEPTFGFENIRRNELCPCGSGKRYKHCHGGLK